MFTKREVKSSAIRSVGYDPDTKILSIEFNHGKVYDYLDVPEETFEEMLKAPSVGKFYNQRFR